MGPRISDKMKMVRNSSNSTYFTHADSEITEMSEFFPIKRSYTIFFVYPFSPLVPFHVNFCDFQEI